MERGKIKRETKKEKRDFRLGGMQEEGESKVLPPSYDTKRVCVRVKKEEAAQERKRRESSQEGAA